MKYNNKIDMVRYHRFNDKWIMIKRQVGCQATYYIDGLFMWTKARGRHDSRLFQSTLGLKPNKEYNDWTPYTNVPLHIPNGQQWRYYFLKWGKELREDDILNSENVDRK
jgi:hypothetical protein